MGIYGWLIIGLIVLFLAIMLFALVSVGPGISPDEEARILAEETRKREMKKALRDKNRAGRKHG